MATDDAPIRPRSLGRQLNFAAGACTAMCNARLAAYDLTLPQWVVLSALWQRDGLTVGEIAEYSGNNIPATSRILDRMVEKDLVQREVDDRDRRAVRVCLAEAGRVLRPLETFHERVNDTLLEGFTQREAELLYALLARVEDRALGWSAE
ncbi:MAG: MarR family transcriptional regulator [Sedimentitalea sp.]|nr:MarR family transcriptional regulator [Sedimentitalea sp.]